MDCIPKSWMQMGGILGSYMEMGGIPQEQNSHRVMVETVGSRI
jgi:hypothetical protein